MSNNYLLSLLKALKTELSTLDNLEESARREADNLEQSIIALIDSLTQPSIEESSSDGDDQTNLQEDSVQYNDAQEESSDSPMDTALTLEAHFASSHPNAERIMREIIDTLAKMGV